jgi:hypothetical protein
LNQVGDTVQIRNSLFQWQQVFPALGDIFVKILGIDTGLDVETEQF